MIGGENRMTTGNTKSRAALARDAALARVSRTRRWVIAGTAALTAGFAALVSVVAPGRSLASKQPARTPAVANTPSASSSAIPQLPPAASPRLLGLQGPDQPPQSIPSPPQQSSPAPSAPQSAPQPAPQSSGGGGVVSGGS